MDDKPTPDIHMLDSQNQVGLWFRGKQHWVPAIPYPLFVTTGLPFWKRFNEKNWRPQCVCDRIFDTMEDYEAHMVYKNSLWGRHDGAKTSNVSVTNNNEEENSNG